MSFLPLLLGLGIIFLVLLPLVILLEIHATKGGPDLP